MNERKIEIPFKEYLRVQPVGRRSNKEKKIEKGDSNRQKMQSNEAVPL